MSGMDLLCGTAVAAVVAVDDDDDDDIMGEGWW